ncbi:MAG: S-layer homology domain-containing protein, partial [Acidimicrobiaceae bacterium]|nr:S-layer homology domain-containing protein [Acidimicrobiaceae bacterium]
MVAAGLASTAAGAAGAAQAQRFPDVPAGHYAHEAIEWAAAVGVTAGYDDGTFKPQQPLSKRHATVFMQRYYDEILGADQSADFTRGDMMVLLKAINDGALRGDTPQHTTPGAAG